METDREKIPSESTAASDHASSAALRGGGWFTAVLAWCWIAASPIVLSAVLGGIAYLAWPGFTGMIIGGTIIFLGIVAGAWWAEHHRRRRGAVTFMAQLTATPDLDDLPPIDDRTAGN